MKSYHKEAFESVDAAIFSGDVLVQSLPEVKRYIARWQRAVIEEEQYREKEAEQQKRNS